MHDWDEAIGDLVGAYASERLQHSKDPRWGAGAVHAVNEALRGTVTVEGLGSTEAMRLIRDRLGRRR